MNKTLSIIACCAVLSACAAGPKERFILLPQADGASSSIVVKTASGETALATPYAAVETQAGRTAKRTTLSETDVQTRYAPVMQNLPKRPRTYELFFELGSDRMTAASRKVLEQAVIEFRSFPAGEFILVGHSDNIGSDANNETLSVRRARLIERELVRAKIEPLSIEVVGKGAREPRVPQKKGAPEPGNRFVEIRLR